MSWCMRTTVNIPDELLSRARVRCVAERQTLGDVIADGLRVVLFRMPPAAKSGRTRLLTFKGEGLRAGVDLDSNAAVLDAMELDG